jgi:hypothetical protein
MSNKSRRRVKMAAGAILAGAAIPIAAAGTAWADDSAAADPAAATTETTKQLEHQGLTHAEAQAVATAEANGTPVEVSHDSIIVVNDNQGTTSTTEATAASGFAQKENAVAIGGGSVADSGTGSPTIGHGPVDLSPGKHDTAFANGAGAEAYSGAGNDDTASATGTGTEAYAVLCDHDTSTANGDGSKAGTGGSFLEYGDHDKATVTGTDSQAYAGTDNANPGSRDSAKVDGSDSTAEAGFGFDKDKAFADGDNLTADATSKNGEHVTVHPSGAEATPLTDPHVGLLPLP